MKIKFIGTGVKKDYEDDLMLLIAENIKKRLEKIDSDLCINFNYKNLSERIAEIECEEDDEIISMSTSFHKDKSNIEVDIKKLSYEKGRINIFVNININLVDDKKDTSDKSEKKDILQEFIYDMKVSIGTAVSKYTKEINWISDEQNERESQYLYVKVYNLENKFRGIINEYMLKNFGEDWFSKKITNEFNKKSEEFSEWYNIKYKSLKFIKSEMFNLQTNDLITMLKNSYEDENITKVMKQINSIKDFLGDKTSDVIKEDVFKNNNLWDKYFRDIFNSDIEYKWQEFAKMRNMIAHNKVISKEFYKDMINLISELDSIFEIANRRLMLKIKSLEEKKINDYIKSCNLDLILESIDFNNYQDDDDVIEEIFWNGDLKGLYSTIEYKIKKLIELYTEFKVSLEDAYLYLEEEEIDEVEKEDLVDRFSQKLNIINKVLNNKDAELIQLLISKTNNIKELNEIGNYLDEFKNDMLERIEIWIENTSYNNEFKDNSNICNYYNVNNDIFNVKISGWFSIEFGSSDKIFIIYKKNENEIERGRIDISFGDYTEHDDGYVMPEQEQYIKVNVEDLCNIIESDMDEIILFISDCIEKISEYI